MDPYSVNTDDLEGRGIDLPEGYSIRAFPKTRLIAVYCGAGAQLVRPTQTTIEDAVEQAWAHFEGRPMVSSEPDDQAAEVAKVKKEDTTTVVTLDEDQVEAEIEKRRAELAGMPWEDVRVLCEAIDIKYRNKTQAIDDIIDVEYPVVETTED